MLADLTAGLNHVLEACRMRLADDLFLVWEGHDLLKAMTVVDLFELVGTLEVRNSIEGTPFPADVIRNLNAFLLTPEHEAIEMPYKTLSNLVHEYQTRLRALADWTEAKNILNNKPSPKKRRGASTLSAEEQWQVYLELVQRHDVPTTKEGFRIVMRQRFPGRTLETNAINRCLKKFNQKYGRKSESGPPNKPD